MQYYNGFNLEKALEELRDMRTEAQPILDAIKAKEKEIKEHVLETGEIAEVDGAKVSIRNGYIRASWDNKALRGYAAVRPEILQFCKETEVGPSAVIKVDLP